MDASGYFEVFAFTEKPSEIMSEGSGNDDAWRTRSVRASVPVRQKTDAEFLESFKS